MCMPEWVRSRLLFLALVLPWHVAAQSPVLGEPLTSDEVAAIDLTIMPDGRGLPEGSGNAGAGETLYRAHCQSCHGDKGMDGPNDALAGGHGTLAGNGPVKTVGSYWPYATTLFDYIRRAMPYAAPGSLDDDEVYALTAYLLNINRVIEADEEMNATTLPRVRMPNAGNFVWAIAVE